MALPPTPVTLPTLKLQGLNPAYRIATKDGKPDSNFLIQFNELVRQLVQQVNGIVAAVTAALEAQADADAAAADAAAAQSTADDAAAAATALGMPQYFVAALSAALANERVLSGGTGVTITLGAGTAVITVSVTAILGYTPVNAAGGAFTAPPLMPNYTVAALPAAVAGDVAYASNGRKNGEGPTAGTGVLVFHDASNWIAVDSGQTVAA